MKPSERILEIMGYPTCAPDAPTNVHRMVAVIAYLDEQHAAGQVPVAAVGAEPKCEHRRCLSCDGCVDCSGLCGNNICAGLCAPVATPDERRPMVRLEALGRMKTAPVAAPPAQPRLAVAHHCFKCPREVPEPMVCDECFKRDQPAQPAAVEPESWLSADDFRLPPFDNREPPDSVAAASGPDGADGSGLAEPAVPVAGEGCQCSEMYLRRRMHHESCPEAGARDLRFALMTRTEQRDTVLSRAETLSQKLAASEVRFEELTAPGCHVCGRDGDEAPCTEHLCDMCSSNWREEATELRRQAEALTKELRSHQVAIAEALGMAHEPYSGQTEPADWPALEEGARQMAETYRATSELYMQRGRDITAASETTAKLTAENKQLDEELHQLDDVVRELGGNPETGIGPFIRETHVALTAAQSTITTLTGEKDMLVATCAEANDRLAVVEERAERLEAAARLALAWFDQDGAVA